MDWVRTHLNCLALVYVCVLCFGCGLVRVCSQLHAVLQSLALCENDTRFAKVFVFYHWHPSGRGKGKHFPPESVKGHVWEPRKTRHLWSARKGGMSLKTLMIYRVDLFTAVSETGDFGDRLVGTGRWSSPPGTGWREWRWDKQLGKSRFIARYNSSSRGAKVGLSYGGQLATLTATSFLAFKKWPRKSLVAALSAGEGGW